MCTCSVNELLKLKYARSISKSAFALHLWLPYPGNLLPGYPPGNTTGTRVPDRKRK